MVSNDCLQDLTAKKIFQNYHNKFNKNLGQNFIFNQNICRNIVHSAGDLAERIIVEIGPGPGGLTLEILKYPIKKLFLLEFDKNWCDVWINLANNYHFPLEVIYCDVLNFDVFQLNPDIIISNLPYNISTKLMYKLFDKFDTIERLVLMFQKEVADRIIAKPKTKSYGKLSVIAQWLSADISKICNLSQAIFTPPPKVESTVLRFIPQKNVEHALYPEVIKILDQAFSHRRKNISKNINDARIIEILETIGYTAKVRAEEISPYDWIECIKNACEMSYDQSLI